MNIKTRTHILLTGVLLIFVFACKKENSPSISKSQDARTTSSENPISIPAANADSLYHFVQKQVDFGPRHPGSTGHHECKEWLVNQLMSYDMEVDLQPFVANVYTGFSFTANNIIASYRPNHKRRVLLAAHWDTRFIADQDPNEAKRKEPILGADDGGSGVSVLLEIARILSENPLDMGVDIVLFDAEDQGDSENHTPHSYCLGSQYWANNLPKDYFADFGILLDMVGSKDALFRKEDYSLAYAREYTDQIWKLAAAMGYSHKFPSTPIGTGIVDDHYYVNTIAKIPMTDIISLPGESRPFGHYWHTHKDDMDVIDKETLRIVAQLVIAVIYKHSNDQFL